MSTYSVGLDLGQSADYTAIAVVQSVVEIDETDSPKKRLHIRHLERYPLRTPYTDVASGVVRLMGSPVFTHPVYDPWRRRMARPQLKLFVDKTGVGAAVTDLLKHKGLKFTSVSIHGGVNVTAGKGGSYNVPKRDLVASLEVPFHTGAVKVAEGLELWSALKEELLTFRRKINLKTAHDSYEHWREGDHDDLVLACALACWGIRRGASRALRVVR